MKNVFLLLSYLLLLWLAFSCKDDDSNNPSTDDDLFTFESIFNCTDFQTHKQDTEMGVISVTEVNGDFIYQGSNGLQIWDDFGENLLHEFIGLAYSTNSVVKKNGYAIICDDNKIYKYDESQELTVLADIPCQKLVLFEDEVVFYSFEGDLMLLSPEDGSYDFYSNPNDEEKMKYVYNVIVIGNKLFGIGSNDSGRKIIEYEGSELVNCYEFSETPGLDDVFHNNNITNTALISVDSDLYYSTNSGPLKYLYKKEGDVFLEILNTDGYDLDSDVPLENTFNQTPCSKFYIRNNNILLPSKRGVFRLDLDSPNLREVELIDDNKAEGDIITHMSFSNNPSDASFVITDARTVVRIGCE